MQADVDDLITQWDFRSVVSRMSDRTSRSSGSVSSRVENEAAMAALRARLRGQARIAKLRAQQAALRAQQVALASEMEKVNIETELKTTRAEQEVLGQYSDNDLPTVSQRLQGCNNEVTWSPRHKDTEGTDLTHPEDESQQRLNMPPPMSRWVYKSEPIKEKHSSSTPGLPHATSCPERSRSEETAYPGLASNYDLGVLKTRYDNPTREEQAQNRQMPTHKPVYDDATPPRPLYYPIDEETSFRNPGGSRTPKEELNLTKPMDRYPEDAYSRREECLRIPTPSARPRQTSRGTPIDYEHGERQHEEEYQRTGSLDRCARDLPRRRPDQLPESQASVHTTEECLESLYQQQSRLLGVLQAPKVGSAHV